MKTIESVDKKICTGCGACFNACPKGAIRMIENKEGFLYPIIDHEKCINCGICYAKCAAVSAHYNNEENPKCYAVWANDEIRMKSASGGMFTLLANYILEKGGYVCGAAWDEEFNVEHIVIHDKKDLNKLQGVKYIQSAIKKTYGEIKNYLKDNFPVLFVGTPCQVAGLKAFLGKEYEQLITVDLVCHGAPSRGVWQKYIHEVAKMAGNKTIKYIQFRNKAYGWGQSLEIYFDDGSFYRNVPPLDCFYETFFILMNTRKSCHSCLFAKMPRQGDLTIGDGWNCSSQMNDRKGTSEVLINNKKGARIFEEIKSSFKKYEIFDIEAAKKGNVALTRPFEKHPDRERFFNLWQKFPIKKAYEYAVKRKFDIGILGIWFYQNYGSVLTTYALGRFLQKNEKEIILINNKPMFDPNHPALNGNLDIEDFFRKQSFEISLPYKTKGQLRGLNRHVDCFITASDQLFNWFLSVEINGYTYFQDFVQADKTKIAYATSFGDGYNFFKKEYYACKPLLQQFDAISVREDLYIDIINHEFDIDATFNMDPVFLISKEEYNLLAEQSKLQNEDYILAYILDITPDKLNLIHSFEEIYKKQVIIVTEPSFLGQERLLENHIESIVKNPNIYDWLYLFKNASLVITDSYHGTLFSVIYNKNFFSIINYLRGRIRFHSILNRLNLKDRLLEVNTEITPDILNTSIDYEEVNKILQNEVRKSSNWLIDNINKPIDSAKREKIMSAQIEELKEKLNQLTEKLNENLNK